MSSKRKSLPSKVLDSYTDNSEMHVDAEETHPLLANPLDSEGSNTAAQDFNYTSVSVKEERPPLMSTPVTTVASPVRWNDTEANPLDNGINAAKRTKREGSSESVEEFPPHINPFVNPFLQARMQQEQARLIEAARQEQQKHHQQQQQEQQQQQQHLQHQQLLQQHVAAFPHHHFGRNSLSPSSEMERAGYFAAKKSMDDVVKKLTSKMSHSTIEDAERLKNER